MSPTGTRGHPFSSSRRDGRRLGASAGRIKSATVAGGDGRRRASQPVSDICFFLVFVRSCAPVMPRLRASCTVSFHSWSFLFFLPVSPATWCFLSRAVGLILACVGRRKRRAPFPSPYAPQPGLSQGNKLPYHVTIVVMDQMSASVHSHPRFSARRNPG